MRDLGHDDLRPCIYLQAAMEYPPNSCASGGNHPDCGAHSRSQLLRLFKQDGRRCAETTDDLCSSPGRNVTFPPQHPRAGNHSVSAAGLAESDLQETGEAPRAREIGDEHRCGCMKRECLLSKSGAMYRMIKAQDECRRVNHIRIKRLIVPCPALFPLGVQEHSCG